MLFCFRRFGRPSDSGVQRNCADAIATTLADAAPAAAADDDDESDTKRESSPAAKAAQAAAASAAAAAAAPPPPRAAPLPALMRDEMYRLLAAAEKRFPRQQRLLNATRASRAALQRLATCA